MPEIEESTGRAHGTECPGGDHINFPQCSLLTQFSNDRRHFFGSYDSYSAVPYPLVDLIDGLVHTQKYVFMNI